MSNNQPSITAGSLREKLKAFKLSGHLKSVTDKAWYLRDEDVERLAILIETEKQGAYRQGQVDELKAIDHHNFDDAKNFQIIMFAQYVEDRLKELTTEKERRNEKTIELILNTPNPTKFTNPKKEEV